MIIFMVETFQKKRDWRLEMTHAVLPALRLTRSREQKNQKNIQQKDNG